MFKQAAGEDYIIFNGPDEQLIAGRMMGAQGAIGGTFGVMPQLYSKADEAFRAGDRQKARAVQYACCNIVEALCSGHGLSLIHI